MQVIFKIALSNSLPGVAYGLQQGQGTGYKTVQKQAGSSGPLRFEFTAELKINTEGIPVFTGPFCQGKPAERFAYIDIGTYSGITDSVSGGRLKIPLYGISDKIISGLKDKSVLQTNVSAVGKNGRPAFGTVKPFEGWELAG